VLRAAGETETTRENIEDWLERDEGDPGFQLLTQEEIAAVVFLYINITATKIIKFSIYLFSNFFLLGSPFCFINPDYLSIRMTFLPPMIPD
jgi:hypothetical protein